MRYFRLSILLLTAFFAAACNQEPGQPAAASSVTKKEKTPLEEQIEKITNTVLLGPLRDIEGKSFYNYKQYLAVSLDNSTQKDVFFSCEEFKKSLQKLLQTDYSADFNVGTWQRTEVEKLAQNIAREQCAAVYTLRANFLADLQDVLNSADMQEDFMQDTKPVVENYAKAILEKNEYYKNILNDILVPYKKLRQIFYPLEKAGYLTYVLEQNDFKTLKQTVTPYLKGEKVNLDEQKINQLLNKAQEEEKVLLVFLKKYDTLTQRNGECIKQFFPGLKDKWYDFMYEIENLPPAKRQALADKRFNQANSGLNTKCADLFKKSKKKKQTQQQDNYQENNNQETYQEANYQDTPQQEEEEVYYF